MLVSFTVCSDVFRHHIIQSLAKSYYVVKNHSVPESIVADVFERSHEFFATDATIKRSVDISKSNGSFRGYMALETEKNDPEGAGDLHEAFNLGLDPSLGEWKAEDTEGQLSHTDNLWPSVDVWSGADHFVSCSHL